MPYRNRLEHMGQLSSDPVLIKGLFVGMPRGLYPRINVVDAVRKATDRINDAPEQSRKVRGNWQIQKVDLLILLNREDSP
jgi:hypothetical protein